MLEFEFDVTTTSTDRRNYLRSVGVSAIATAGLSGIAAAGGLENRPAEEGSSVKELGLDQKVESFLENRKLKELERVFERNDVETNYRAQEVRFTIQGAGRKIQTTEVSGDNPRIGPQDYFESSTFAGGVYNYHGDKYAAVTAADLSDAALGRNADGSGPSPRDVASVGWEGDIFGATGETMVTTELDFPDGSTKDMSPKYKNKPNDPTVGPHPNAYVLGLKDDKKSFSRTKKMAPKSAYAGFQCKLRKQSQDTGQIVPKYMHTWSFLNIAKFNILESLTIAPKGVGINLDLPHGADSYSLGRPYNR